MVLMSARSNECWGMRRLKQPQSMFMRKTRLKRRQSGLFLMEQMTPFRHPVTVTFNNEMLEIECLKQDITNIHQTKTVGRYDHGQESGTVSFSFYA